jgi:hypothetical protein
LEQKDAA